MKKMRDAPVCGDENGRRDVFLFRFRFVVAVGVAVRGHYGSDATSYKRNVKLLFLRLHRR